MSLHDLHAGGSAECSRGDQIQGLIRPRGGGSKDPEYGQTGDPGRIFSTSLWKCRLFMMKATILRPLQMPMPDLSVFADELLWMSLHI